MLLLIVMLLFLQDHAVRESLVSRNHVVRMVRLRSATWHLNCEQDLAVDLACSNMHSACSGGSTYRSQVGAGSAAGAAAKQHPLQVSCVHGFMPWLLSADITAVTAGWVFYGAFQAPVADWCQLLSVSHHITGVPQLQYGSST